MIDLNMSVSVPNEIYEKFLTELGRDGFVFAKFGEYTLVLSMQVHEVCTTLTQEERLEIGAPENAGKVGSIHSHLTLQLQSKDDKILCKCGHWIGVVGTKWQHMAVIITDSCGGETPQKSEVKYQERCYYCDCIEPIPARDDK